MFFSNRVNRFSTKLNRFLTRDSMLVFKNESFPNQNKFFRPNNYFSDSTSEELDELKKSLLSNPREISLNDEMISDIDCNWQSAGKMIYRNWLESLASA